MVTLLISAAPQIKKINLCVGLTVHIYIDIER